MGRGQTINIGKGSVLWRKNRGSSKGDGELGACVQHSSELSCLNRLLEALVWPVHNKQVSPSSPWLTALFSDSGEHGGDWGMPRSSIRFVSLEL